MYLATCLTTAAHLAFLIATGTERVDATDPTDVTTRYTIQSEATSEFMYIETGDRGPHVADVFTSTEKEISKWPKQLKIFMFIPVGDAYQIVNPKSNLMVVMQPMKYREIDCVTVKEKFRDWPGDNALWYLTVTPNEKTRITNKNSNFSLYGHHFHKQKLRLHTVVGSLSKDGHHPNGSFWYIREASP